MSTNAQIGMKLRNGTIRAIYLHRDGYPSHALKILRKYYTDRKIVRKLIGLGDMSSLGAYIGDKHDFDCPNENECNYYGRDRGETDVGFREFSSKEEWLKAAGEEYNYLFVDGQWEQANLVHHILLSERE